MNANDFPKKLFDQFFDLAEKTAETHPHLVVLCFYDFNMTIRPNYPQEKTCVEVAEALESKTRQYISLLKSGSCLFPTDKVSFGGLKVGLTNRTQKDIKNETGDMYGRQWKKFDVELQFNFARKAIIQRLGRNGFSLDWLKGKRVIDIGCGSGRYSCALASFGPEEVVAVDWGEDGLAFGNSMAEIVGVTNVRFQKASIIDMPFEDEEFDFCFANGVFHHTEDLWKGVSEQSRITKKGGAGWLYLYGAGGLFWNSREKMRFIMSNIPEDYAERVLGLISHDRNWFVPMDVWYVPIEIHTWASELEPFLDKIGYSEFERIRYGLPGDRTLEFMESDDLAPLIYGEGDLRYLLRK